MKGEGVLSCSSMLVELYSCLDYVVVGFLLLSSPSNEWFRLPSALRVGLCSLTHYARSLVLLCWAIHY